MQIIAQSKARGSSDEVVIGPASSLDNAVARYDGATGKLLQNSVVTIDDVGSVNIPAGQTYMIDGVAHEHDNRYFTEVEHVNVSTGVAQAGLPVVLDATGVLDSSLLPTIPPGYDDESAQDAVGTILLDTASIDFTYDDGTPNISAVVLPGGVDHDSLLNFVANEHIDHTAVSVIAGGILTGGGTIAANRTITLANADIDHNQTTNTHNLTTDIDHDSITNTHNLTTDVDHNTITNGHNLTTDIDHDALTNFVALEHAPLNDVSILTTNVWSASKIDGENALQNISIGFNNTHRNTVGNPHGTTYADVGASPALADPLEASLYTGIGALRSWTSMSSLVDDWDESNVVYVGKHGDDANNGLSISKAKLTFMGTNGAMSVPSGISSSNRYMFRCVDAGTYVESITLPEWCFLDAPAAVLEGNHIATGVCVFYTGKLQASSGACITKTLSRRGSIRVANITGSDTASGVSLGANALLDMFVDRITVNTGNAVEVTSPGSVKGSVGNIDVLSTGGVGLYVTNGLANVDLSMSSVEGGAGTIGIDLLGNCEINVLANDVSCGIAVRVGNTSQLNLITSTITGTQTIDPGGTFNLVSSGDGIDFHSDINIATGNEYQINGVDILTPYAAHIINTGNPHTVTLDQARIAGDTLAGSVDFANYEAIRMVCHNDLYANIPTSGMVDGQWFYANNIACLFLYEQGWKPIISFGPRTIYVNGAVGTSGNGTSTTPFKTIQEAVDAIPSINGGNVTVEVAAATYAESVTILGKGYAVPASITFNGVISSIESGTATDSARGTFPHFGAGGMIEDDTASWTVDEFKGRLLYSSQHNETRVIASNTATEIYTIGRWGANLGGGGGTYSVNDWDSIMEPQGKLDLGFVVGAGQVGIVFNQMKVYNADGHVRPVYLKAGCELTAFYSNFDNGTSDSPFSVLMGGAVFWLQSSSMYARTEAMIQASAFVTIYHVLLYGNNSFNQHVDVEKRKIGIKAQLGGFVVVLFSRVEDFEIDIYAAPGANIILQFTCLSSQVAVGIAYGIYGINCHIADKGYSLEGSLATSGGILDINKATSGYLQASGVGNTSATYSLLCQDNAATPNELFRVADDGGVHAVNLKSGTSKPGSVAVGELWIDTTSGLNIIKVG